MLASADQVAIDAVAAKMMGFDPMTIEYIRLAHEDGLGVGRSARTSRSSATTSRRETGASRSATTARRMVGDLMWFGPLKRFQKLFFHTPLVNLFIAGSRGLSRLLPLAASRTGRSSSSGARTTEWGQLFDQYVVGAADVRRRRR